MGCTRSWRYDGSKSPSFASRLGSWTVRCPWRKSAAPLARSTFKCRFVEINEVPSSSLSWVCEKGRLQVPFLTNPTFFAR